MSDDDRLKNEGDSNLPKESTSQHLRRMPLKLLVVSELTTQKPSPEASQTPQRIPIDKNTFNKIMETFDIRLCMKVPNRLSAMPEELLVELSLQNIRSFHPGPGFSLTSSCPTRLIEAHPAVRDTYNKNQVASD